MKHALLLVLITACGPQLDPMEEPPSEQRPPPAQPPPAQPPPPAPMPTGLPCDVQPVLQAACAGCHVGATPLYFPFASRQDLLPLRERFTFRLGSTRQPMPPQMAARQLSTAERELLLGWAANGMPAGDCGGLR